MKKRAFNEKQEAEYQFIKEWCLTVMGFIFDQDATDKQFIDLYYEGFSDERKDRLLAQVSPSLYLTGMRQGFRDTNEMAKDAPVELLNQLNKILREKFGKDLNDDLRDTTTRIKQILKRGKINSDEEYEIVERRVDELSQTDNTSAEIEKLNNLLIIYHPKV